MKQLRFALIIIFVLMSDLVPAQLGVRAGLNMANEIKSLSTQAIVDGFKTDNLTGYQIGLVYEINPKKSGIGVDFGILASQKGCTYTDSISIVNQIITGYEEINYLEIPINLRYKVKLGIIGIFGLAGVYGGYALNGAIVNETTNGTNNSTLSFTEINDHLDYGVQLGAGFELLNKIQLGINYSYGLKQNSFGGAVTSISDAINNRVFSVNLTYLF